MMPQFFNRHADLAYRPGRRRPALFPYLLAIGLILILGFGSPAWTQSGVPGSDSAWQTPVNLSQSGWAGQPRFLFDAGGRAHLLWRDQFQGFLYRTSDNLSLGQEAVWSEIAAVELPFGTRRYFPELQPTAATPRFNPHLLADNSGRLHAFWLDGDDRLYHSSVAAGAFSDFDAWTVRLQLAEAARTLAVTLGPDGRIHLVYLRPLATTAFPAGVYYRSSETGLNWSAPHLLYESPYLRGLPADEAHLQIAAADQGESNSIYAGWDNRPREQLYLARSPDNGQNWEAPRLVDSRLAEAGPQAAGPSQLLIHAQAGNVLLTWQAGHDGRTCEQQFQFSADGGASWSERQPVAEALAGCPATTQLLRGGEGVALLLVRQETQGSLLLAWDGFRWSEPQPQAALDNFLDPVTSRQVEFACYQPAVNGQDDLFIAGCDQGRSQDIWLMARSLGGVLDWFPPPPEASVWRAPIILAEPGQPPAGVALLGDDDGRFHAFWAPEGDVAIQYARGEAGQWSRSSPVLRSPEEGVAGQPAVAITASRLLAAWPDLSQGGLYFSWANVDRATAVSEWTAPMRLPAPRPLVSAVALAVDRRGDIYVAYTIPLNEERGVYLTWSANEGQSWSPAVTVFDGVAAGWTAVGAPRLAVDGGGGLHASWTGQGLNGQPEGLYYAYSPDGGLTWPAESTVTGGELPWQQLLAVDDRLIHQLWAGQGGTATTTAQPALWHRFSEDGGQSWSRPARVAGLGANPVGPAGAVLDEAGQLHVVQLAPEGSATEAAAPLWLRHWIWQEMRWQGEAAVAWGDGRAGNFDAPAAAAIDNWQLGFVYLAGPPAVLLASDRPLPIPAALPTPLPPLPLPATPTPQPTSTPTPQPLPTPFFPTEAEPNPGLTLPLPDDRLARPLVGAIPAVFLILIALSVGLYIKRRH